MGEVNYPSVGEKYSTFEQAFFLDNAVCCQGASVESGQRGPSPSASGQVKMGIPNFCLGSLTLP